MTFEELQALGRRVRDEVGKPVAVRSIAKYIPKGEYAYLRNVPESSYDELAADFVKSLAEDEPMSEDEKKERLAMRRALLAFKKFWRAAQGQQAEEFAVDELVDTLFDFRKQSR